MFGRKMLQPEGVAAALEADVLTAAGLCRETFNQDGPLRLEGERRPLRVPLGNPSARLEDDDLVLEFALPKGAYATSVLREVMK
jgi:tRNA pseudouridine13 synthase